MAKSTTVKLSEGAERVVDRMTNKAYTQFQKDLEEAISAVMRQYGYDSEIAMAFDEHYPVYVERSK